MISPNLIGTKRALQKNKLFLNSFNLMLTTGLTAGFGFLFWIIVARSSHSSTVGIATTLLSISFLISLMGMAGFDTIFIRFLPKSIHKSEEINSGLILSGLATTILSIIFVLATPIIAPRLSFLFHDISYLICFVIFTVFTTWNSLTNAVLISYRRTSFILAIDIIFSLIKISLPLLIKANSPMTIFSIVGIAQVVNVALSLIVMIKVFRYRPALRAKISYLKEVAQFGTGMYVANLLNLMPDSILPIIVIDRLGPSSAAYFYVTFAIANLIYTIAFATNQALLAEASADEENFDTHARRGLLISGALLIPTIVLMILFAPFALSFFGHNYVNGSTDTLRVMAVSGIFVLVYSFLSFVFKHKKNLKAILAMTAVNAAVILGLGIYLTRYGLVGVGYAWLVGTAAAVVVGIIPFIQRRGPRQVPYQPHNILVTHVYSEENKGDAALLSVLLSDIRHKFNKPSITILTLDNIDDTNASFDETLVQNSFMYYAMNKFKSRPLVLAYSMYVISTTICWAAVRRLTGQGFHINKQLHEVCRRYDNSDLIIPVGGGYLRSQKSGVGSLLNVVLLLHPYVVARILNRPTILYAQSIGPFANSIEEKLVASVLSHCVQAAIIREDISMELLESIGVSCPLYRSIDSGFAFAQDGVSIDIRKMLNIPANEVILGVTVRRWLTSSAQEEYEEAITQTIEFITQRHDIHVVLIPQVTAEFHNDDDRVVQERIVSHLKRPDRVHSMKDKFNHHEIKRIYDSLDYLIGTRFHSVIFSLTSGVPAIAIEYEHKTGGIMRDLGLGQWVVKMEEVRASTLITMTNRLMTNSDAYRKVLRKSLPAYIARTKEPIEIVEKTYKSLTEDKSSDVVLAPDIPNSSLAMRLQND